MINFLRRPRSDDDDASRGLQWQINWRVSFACRPFGLIILRRRDEMGKEIRKAVAYLRTYLRTSSRTNVGADKDSDKRQRAAIEVYAKAAGYEIVQEFYDAAVSGRQRRSIGSPPTRHGCWHNCAPPSAPLRMVRRSLPPTVMTMTSGW
jgi:hypothetical protein